MDPRKTMTVSKEDYARLKKAIGTCTIDGTLYKRLRSGVLTRSTDICVGYAPPKVKVYDASSVAYYRLPAPPPPTRPSRDVLERVRKGEGTADEITLLAVWAQNLR